MQHMKRFLSIVLLSFTLIILTIPSQKVFALSSDYISFIILSEYETSANIGDQFYIIAFTSNGKKPTWKSSDSKVASVNTYGKVTAKKSGTAIITAKIKNAEAYCEITVNKTEIKLNLETASLERGESLKLTASTSNGSKVIWKSSKKSIATIDKYGNVTAIKPGETILTAKADDSSLTCKLTVKKPTVLLNKSSVILYRNQTCKLTATVSSKVSPKWKTNKKSVAIVDETGTITAKKNGTAIITATVDGVSKTCTVTVQKPEISLNCTEVSIKKGTTKTMIAKVSSGNPPNWSTSNSKVVTINSQGRITAIKKGTAYIYASEDGTKVKCKVIVTE